MIDFGRLGRRKVEGRFDGGIISSDAGVMLLARVDAASRAVRAERTGHAVRWREGGDVARGGGDMTNDRA